MKHIKRIPIFVHTAIISDRQFSCSYTEPYGYIYRTTNNLDNKKYIGQHARPEFDENYYGSGTILLKALKKHGKENFTVIVLDWAETKEELDQKEIEWIARLDAVRSDAYYNIVPGVVV